MTEGRGSFVMHKYTINLLDVMRKKIKQHSLRTIPLLLIITGFFVMINVFFLFLIIQSQPTKETNNQFPELMALGQKQFDFNELTVFFRKVAEQKGSAYAFGLMNAASIPPGTDMHLLAHEIGDVLYKKEGATGMRLCNEDFRNACSHSIVVGLFRDKGEEALPIIADACRLAPGGTGAYTMCFHGLGHGILAYAGYDLTRSTAICKKTGTPAYRNREYVECVGGSIMEITGGVHDARLREKQAKKYLSSKDPLSPCSADFMDDSTRPLCYLYLTPHLLTLAGADLGDPNPQYFKKAFGFCDLIKSSSVDRDACYAGFGKEYIGIVRSRDARLSTLISIDDDKLTLIYEWCMGIVDRSGARACLLSAENSLYWGGEHGENLPLSFCAVFDDQSHRDECFSNLIGALHFYKPDPRMREVACKKFPVSYQKQCVTG